MKPGMLEQGCKALAKRIADPSYDQNPISRSRNALERCASPLRGQHDLDDITVSVGK